MFVTPMAGGCLNLGTGRQESVIIMKALLHFATHMYDEGYEKDGELSEKMYNKIRNYIGGINEPK